MSIASSSSGPFRPQKRPSSPQMVSTGRRGGGSPQIQPRLLAPPDANQRKRNSFHGFCLPGMAMETFDSAACAFGMGCPQCGLHINNGGGIGLNRRQNGTSLLQLPNQWQNGAIQSALDSPTASEEELLLPYCPGIGMLKPKYSLNLRPEDCGPQPQSTPPTHYQKQPPRGGQSQQLPSTPSTAKSPSRVAILAQANRQQGSTDSAPNTAGISSKKRKEIWARAGPCSFHQSFDIRTDPLSLSNSCPKIDDPPGSAAGSGCNSSGGFRTERRSGFCSGDTSRDSRSHPGHLLSLLCGAPGCSGHAPCPGALIGVPHHRQPPIRSAHSSFDEGDPREGHLRDTYLTEISREWMLMNGAITPFKNILQQASSIASTPLANHRPIQSPAGPAAAAAVTTATAILGHKGDSANRSDDLMGGGGGGPYAAGQAIRGSCHNLAAVTAAATTSPSLLEQLNRRRDSYAAAPNGKAVVADCGPEPIIIIESRQKEGGRRMRETGGWGGGWVGNAFVN